MSETLFSNDAGLDVEYLEEMYADDLETAGSVFEEYLLHLKSNTAALEESFLNNDIYQFRQLVHKLKPGFSYVGLTDVGRKIIELEGKCVEGKDLVLNEIEIRQLMVRIQSSGEAIREILKKINKQIRV